MDAMTSASAAGSVDSAGPVLGIALLGCGHVGGEVARALRDPRALAALEHQAGARLQLRAIAVRGVARLRDALAADGAAAATPDLSGDVVAAAQRPDVDIVVELIGGEERAGQAVRAALASGKAVVTANKALLAAQPGLFAVADAAGAPLLFEAATAGAIPVLRALEVSLAGDRVRRLAGIVNGTCNFILTRMADDGLSFEAALAEAQASGFAEADPAADVDGVDAASKLALLARLAFGAEVAPTRIDREGIRGVRAEDIRRARELGLTIRLLAIGERLPPAGDGSGDERFDLRVHPTLLSSSHPLAAVRGPMNAVWVEAALAGPLMFYGQGAGGRPTASAVLGDVVAAARALVAKSGGARVAQRPACAPLSPVAAAERESAWHVACLVADRSGVLAAIALAFARADVSVASCVQHGRGGGPVELVFVLHRAREAQVARALAEIEALPFVSEVASRLRVLDDGSGGR